MREAHGDFSLAAEGIGRSEAAVRRFVSLDPQLSALWLPNRDDVTLPDEEEVMNRTPTSFGVPNKISGDVLGEAMMRQNREILRQGLQAAGIRPETINKLQLFEGMAENTGAFLAAGLDITHKLTLFQGVSLFEQAEKIKKQYLEDESLPMELRIEWAKVYTEISELVGKTSDRMLVATQAAVAMLKKKEEGDSKGEKVVGFQPLQSRPKP